MAKNEPNSALKSLEVLVGTWNVSGEAHGQVSFEWVEGKRILLQRVDLDGAKGIEVIRYDQERKVLTSYYFDNSGSKVLNYIYKVANRTLTVTLDMPDRKGALTAALSDDGNTLTGRWDWVQDGTKMGYDATLTKVKQRN
ncbi:MAG: hypothetical protein AAB834_04935 [Patescibacteria group bacterium]